MIHKLSIRNFKSIRELDLDCRRVNVFIGEPNAGKTNVLEALGLWCPGVLSQLNQSFRIGKLTDLLWNLNDSESARIQCDSKIAQIEANVFGLQATYTNDKGEASTLVILEDTRDVEHKSGDKFAPESIMDVGFYLFDPMAPTHHQFDEEHRLNEPFGTNIGILLSHQTMVRKVASSFFDTVGLKVTVDRKSLSVLVAREVDGVMITFPYQASSETVRRMFFFDLVLRLNQNRILILDEPEAHSFPPYTKTLAERIALDDRGNQFFLTTHSPYMLDSLLSKTPASDLNVVLCRMENFETKAYPLNQEQVDQIKEWSMDAFFNFDRLLPEVK